MTAAPRLCRSALFVPASTPRAIEKARGLACDVVIFDLEDAVAPDAKDAARAAAWAAIRQGGFGNRQLVVRTNAIGTACGVADLAMAAAAKPDAVLLPKVAGAADVAAAAQALPDIAIWAMIETPAAVLALDAIGAAPPLAALVVGTNDLSTMLRARPGPDRQALQSHLARTVAVARAHDLIALDGVFNAIADAEGLAKEAAQGRAFGFDGKSLIHPGQIDICNTIFSPTTDEIDNAERIVSAFAANPAAGVLRVDGRMVERLHLIEAERVLTLSRQISGDGLA